MQNWKDYRNFRKRENADGSFTYTITVGGADVEVSAGIYEVYAQGGYKMENMELGLKRDRVLRDSDGKTVKDEHGNTVFLPEREVSLDRLMYEDWEFSSQQQSPEDAFISSAFSEEVELRRCLALLADDEHALVHALFYEGLTERKYAKILGISKTALHARKMKILTKIKNFWRQ